MIRVGGVPEHFNYMISIDKGQKTLKDFGYELIDEKG